MRNPQFQIETYWDSLRMYYVKKATKVSQQHLQAIRVNHEKIKQLYSLYDDISIVSAESETDLELLFEKVDGRSLINLVQEETMTIDEALLACTYIQEKLPSVKKTRVPNMFGPYGWRIYEDDDYVSGVIDLTGSNIFLNASKDGFTLIDQERYSPEPLPKKLLLFRTIHDLFYRGLFSGSDFVSLCSEYGIMKRQIPILKYQENSFHYYVGLGPRPRLYSFIRDIWRTYANTF